MQLPQYPQREVEGKAKITIIDMVNDDHYTDLIDGSSVLRRLQEPLYIWFPELIGSQMDNV